MANPLKSIARYLFGGDEQRQWNDTGNGAWFTPGVGSTHVTADSALSLSAVWACQTLIADSIATLPVDAYRSEGDRRIPVDPPDWVEQPNPEYDRVDYDTQRILSLLGWGNAWALLLREGGHVDPMAPVVERWMVHPSRVQVRRVGRDLATFIDGIFVPQSLIQHIRGYTQPGDLCGMSVVEHANQSLSISLQGDTFSRKFFENGVAPSGVLTVPQMPTDVSKEVIERMREQFMDRYAGTGNARKPVVLTGGTTWSQITLSPADAQMLETRKFQIEEIARWHRVPLHKIQQITGNASQGGGNGLEQMALEFAQDGLLPWTVRLERADSMLLPPGQRLRYNLNAYVRVDMKTRAEVLAIQRQNGVRNADEWRALEDEAPIGGKAGSVYWMPVNMSDASQEPVSTPADAPGSMI